MRLWPRRRDGRLIRTGRGIGGLALVPAGLVPAVPGAPGRGILPMLVGAATS